MALFKNGQFVVTRGGTMGMLFELPDEGVESEKKPRYPLSMRLENNGPVQHHIAAMLRHATPEEIEEEYPGVGHEPGPQS